LLFILRNVLNTQNSELLNDIGVSTDPHQWVSNGWNKIGKYSFWV